MTVGAQIPAIYAQALARYHETTKGDCPLDAAFLAKLHTVEDLTQEIELQNGAFSEFRQKRGTLFNVLETALLPIELFGNLAAGGASMAFPPSSLIFGAVSYLMGAAKGVSVSYDAIQDLMGTLKDFTIRLKAYNREAISEDLSNKLSDILVTLLEIFALATKTIRRGRLLKFTRNVLLGSDDAIQAALGKLDKLTRVEASLVGAETLTESKRTGRVVDSVSVTVNETNTSVNQMTVQVTEVHEMMAHLVVSSKEKGEQRRQNVAHDVLKPSSTDSAQDRYEKITKARLPGTGDWIHNEEIFQNWLAGLDNPILFVTGNPGAGKSYLSANIISFLQDHPEHLEKQQEQGQQEEPTVSVGYFFFKDDNPHTRSFHQALRDLAYQISKNDPVYEKYLSNIEDYSAISTIESAWRVLFADFFLQKTHGNHSVYILLDGVDEAFNEERQTFLHLARELYDNSVSSPQRLHFVFVGRPHLSDQLLEALDTDIPTIHVTSQKNSSDIERYIKASIKKSVILRKVSTKLRQEIFEKLSAGAEGMFLWVNLMLQELVKKRSESSMRKSLEEAPKGLREMLRRVLWSFSSTSTDEELMYLNEMLLWTACSPQPLNLEQMEALLRLQSPEGDGMIDPEGALRKQFAAFFTVDRADGLTTAELLSRAARQDGSDFEDDDEGGDIGSVGGYSDGDIGSDEEGFDDVENLADFDSDKFTTTVTFCHASIGDYLRDESEGKVSAGEGHVSVGVNWNEAQLHVLKTYLKLLTDETFREKSGNKYCMLQFASRNWVRALRSTTSSTASLEDKKAIVSMLVRLFTEDDLMALWLGKNDWVSTQENLDAVRQWLQDEEVVKSLTPEAQEFIASTKDDHKATFKPLILLCVRQWVCEDWGNVVPTSAMVWAHMKFLQGNEINDPDLYHPTAEEIIEAAEFGGFEKTANWHGRCAITLREKGFFDVALDYFVKAIELDPEVRAAKTGLAKTYMCKKEWQKALDIYNGVEQTLLTQIEEEPAETLDSVRDDLHDTMTDMGTCYRELGEPDKHFDVIKRSMEHRPDCDKCINAIITHQHERKLYADTMTLLEDMAAQTIPDTDWSLLTSSMWENPFRWSSYFKYTADAALATDRLDFLIDSWHVASREARKASDPFTAAFIDLSLAQIYAEWANDQPKAIKSLEKIIDTFAAAKDGSTLGFVKDEAATLLATRLLCRAIDLGVGTPEAEAAIAKLEALGQRVKMNEKSSMGSIARARSVALGVYYRLSGRAEEARERFRPSVKRCVNLLSDDDPGNDCWGLIDLLSVLLRAADAKNALVVAYFLGKYPDEKEAEVDDDEHAIRAFARGDDYFAWRCNGPCHKECMVMDELSLCTICPETGFCSECLELLRQDQMTIHICSSKHVDDFLLVPTRPQTTKGDQVIFDGKVMEFQVWMEQLKKEWRVR